MFMLKPPLSTYAAVHFRLHVADRVGFVELNRPDRKNPLIFDSYAELRDLFRALRACPQLVIAAVDGVCMKTEDFKRAFDIFAARNQPQFVGQ
jgi:enoyl-CoA hydratase/carnithine racemase